jgi:hypothetical protein
MSDEAGADGEEGGGARWKYPPPEREHWRQARVCFRRPSASLRDNRQQKSQKSHKSQKSKKSHKSSIWRLGIVNMYAMALTCENWRQLAIHCAHKGQTQGDAPRCSH